MAILIKRYANRKLYNTDTSRYITLKGIAKLLEEGKEVRVMDNETGEDITQVALSQILVDNKRAKEDPSDTLLSQILARGGDALYGAIRKSVDDATDGLGDFQERLKRIVNQSESLTRPRRGFGWDPRAREERNRDSRDSDGEEWDESESLSHDEAEAKQGPGLEALVRRAVGEAIEAYDLPHRKEIENLTRNLDRVAAAVERIESAYRTSKRVSDLSPDEDESR